MSICPKCGAQNIDGAPFCGNCGTALSSHQAPPPFYGTQPAPRASQAGKGLGIAGMVCGIVALVFSFCTWFPGLGAYYAFFTVIPAGILSIVFGALSKSKGYKGGMATVGIILGSIGLGLGLIFGTISCIACDSPYSSYYYLF